MTPESPRTGRSAEAALHALVKDRCLDDTVLDYIFPGNHPHAWETSLWDYKRRLPATSGRDSAAADEGAFLELVKDVVAFHNAYGGYILAGVDQHAIEPVVGCDNLGEGGFTVEKLNEKVKGYTREAIECRFRKIGLDGGRQVGLLFIPMRSEDKPPIQFLKGAPELGPKRGAFAKGDIFARIDDACVPVQSDLQGLQFICSRRNFQERLERTALENNLPARDPNFIRFVGRTHYMLQLWSWLTDRHAPVKVLTALGGSGKTTIAYEFCRQLISSPPAWTRKLIWLTAKKRAYSAVRGEYVSVTRTDFESVDGLLGVLAQELGVTPAEIADTDDVDGLLDLVLEGLTTFPSIVIVDDVDSLDQSSQAELFATVQTVAGRSFERGARFLLTSRLELGAGGSQRIQVRGFEEAEFAEYARMTASERNITLDDGVIQRLLRASLGSPIFADSIFRLVSLGTDINTAINRWKGKEGEAVRSFAFERELNELTDSQARTLFALCALGETTQLELTQVLNIDDGQMTGDLAKLREYHLFASSGDPATGTKLSVPEPIRLMSGILRSKLLDPVRIEKECARVRAQVPKVQDRVAAAVASILALWKADDYEAALMSAGHIVRNNPKSGDLQCILGQCNLKVSPAKAQEADKAFRRAFEFGCTRPELVPNWFEAKLLSRDWAGIVDLTGKIAPPEIRGRSATISLMAEMEVARQMEARGDSRSAEAFRKAMEHASRVIRGQRAGDQLAAVREVCRNAARSYVQAVQRTAARAGDRLDVFNAVMDAFDCHITETWMLEDAADALEDWATDVLSRSTINRSDLDILDRRLDALASVRAHLEEKPWLRMALLSRIEKAQHRLEGARDSFQRAVTAAVSDQVHRIARG
jgi:hypothetical protein